MRKFALLFMLLGGGVGVPTGLGYGPLADVVGTSGDDHGAVMDKLKNASPVSEADLADMVKQIKACVVPPDLKAEQASKGQEAACNKAAASVKSGKGKQRVFEPSSKHDVTRPGVGAQPTNPQRTLERAVPVSVKTTKRLVGTDRSASEFVVFDITRSTEIADIYHGHTRDWDELTQAMKNVLRKGGYANAKGKILK